MLNPETIRLLASAKKDVDRDKDEENVPSLESVEVVLVHCNLVKNYYNTPKVLFTFVPNKQFGQLTNVASHSLTMMKSFLLLKFGLQIKIAKHLKLKIISI